MVFACLAFQVHDLRSAVVRETCRVALTCFAQVAKALGEGASEKESTDERHAKEVVGHAGLVFLKSLLGNLFVSVKIIRGTSEQCGREMLKRLGRAAISCVDFLLQELDDNKHWQVRANFAAWLALVCHETFSDSPSYWDKKRMDMMEEALEKASKDKKAEVRKEADKALKEIRLLRLDD